MAYTSRLCGPKLLWAGSERTEEQSKRIQPLTCHGADTERRGSARWVSLALVFVECGHCLPQLRYGGLGDTVSFLSLRKNPRRQVEGSEKVRETPHSLWTTLSHLN